MTTVSAPLLGQNIGSLSWLLKMGCLCGKELITVNGRQFQVRTQLGEGGFSYVELVEDIRTHRLYALKRISCQTPEDEIKAQKEVEVHDAVQHKNIIACEDWTLLQVRNPAKSIISELLLVLPYYRRGTLADELMMRAKTKAFMAEYRIYRLFHGVCDGVRAMHRCKPVGFTHRDVKAANVLLTDDDIPVLMDLGSAGPLNVDVQSGSQALSLQDEAAEKCSMPYRAPELFHVEHQTLVDERIDIWSLGCLLFAMAFFKSPFEEIYEKGGSIALAVVGGKINIPEEHPYSSSLIELIRELLKVDPQERPFIEQLLERIKLLDIPEEGSPPSYIPGGVEVEFRHPENGI